MCREYKHSNVYSKTQCCIFQVLDMGFNRVRNIPDDAFTGNKLLTLLALDGNPLSTLSETTFVKLNSTLRGLSVGGKHALN